MVNEAFGFELPDKDRQLTNTEYVNLVNRIRGNFLSYVSVLDSMLGVIISDLFLRDKNDLSLWARTVFDEDRTASFGAKIVWMSRILRHHAYFRDEVDEGTRLAIQRKLDEIRVIRNDFAHTHARNKRVKPKNVRDRVIELYDFEEGVVTPRKFGMEEIMDIINDGWITDQLARLEALTGRIRRKGVRDRR